MYCFRNYVFNYYSTQLKKLKKNLIIDHEPKVNYCSEFIFLIKIEGRSRGRGRFGSNNFYNFQRISEYKPSTAFRKRWLAFFYLTRPFFLF